MIAATNDAELRIVTGVRAAPASSVPQTPYRSSAATATVATAVVPHRVVGSEYLSQLPGDQVPDFYERGREQQNVWEPERSSARLAFPFYDFAV